MVEHLEILCTQSDRATATPSARVTGGGYPMQTSRNTNSTKTEVRGFMPIQAGETRYHKLLD